MILVLLCAIFDLIVCEKISKLNFKFIDYDAKTILA